MTSRESDPISVINRTALLVRPTGAFLAWANAFPGDPFELTLEDIRNECSIYLLPVLRGGPESWLRRNFTFIFEEELFGWCTDDELWPRRRTFKLFREFFDVSFHSMVYDMGKGGIVRAG